MNLYWLSVEEPVENLYQQVKNFWAFEGYGLIVDEPVIGIMQTEWIFTDVGRPENDPSWWDKLWSSGTYASSQNQYKTRIERDPSGQASNRIYIAHRGTEISPTVKVETNNYANNYTKKINDSGTTIDWRFRRAEPELEVKCCRA